MHFHCAFSDSLILAGDYSTCYLFGKNGKVIRKIGNEGRGPGEYLILSQMDFGNNSDIYLRSSGDILEYSTDGQFINRYKDILKNDTGFIGKWLQLNDSLFIGYIANSSGIEKNRFAIFSKYGNVKHELKNYRILERKKPYFSDTESYADLYCFKYQIFIKQIVNDTLFVLTSDYRLQPKYVFDFGKYSHQPFLGGPEELMEYSLKKGNTITLENIFQTNDHYFLCCDFHLNFPAKRLTTKTVRANITSDYNTTMALGVLNKRTNNFSFCQATETDNPLYTTGLINDIDGGPRFYPMKMINDSTMVMWIDALEFVNHINSPEFIASQPVFPDKKQSLIEFASKISDTDNPVLMCVTF
jgi:hypothetical protein